MSTQPDPRNERAGQPCKHPPTRLYSGTGRDARVATGWVRWVACCACGATLDTREEPASDAARNTLIRQAAKAAHRRFSGDALTGFGAL